MRLSSSTRFTLLMLLLLGLLTTYAGCGGRDLVGDAKGWLLTWFGPKTPRTKYRRAAEETDFLLERELLVWDASYEVAKTTPLRIGLPHRELLRLDTQLVLSAQAVRFTLPPGRELTIDAADSYAERLFGELFRWENGTVSKRPVAYFGEDDRQLTYVGPRSRAEELLFVTQTAPLRPARVAWSFLTRPLKAFPVSGKDESAIQSFWGANRDGGRRKHEGNDIFADRGTELVAVTNGTITRTGNGGLGGKTVWLRDEDTGLRYYYAHLDEIRVGKNQIVARGQTVGTVGNTGNARTTPPHLHFGIYDGGAIDPYPFLQRADALPVASPLRLAAPSAPLTVPRSGNHYLRLTPARDGTKIRQLDNGESVTGLGTTGRFYRIKTERGEVGYANFD